MFIELTRGADKVTISINHIIIFFSDTNGGSGVICSNEQVIRVNETYEEIKNTIEDLYI